MNIFFLNIVNLKKKNNNENFLIEVDDFFNLCKKVSFIKYLVII